MTGVRTGLGERSLVVSVDTEEDNWQPTREEMGCTNIAQLPRIQSLFRQLGVRPTYFVTYAVLENDGACEILRELEAEEGVELGAHLHPWNTPPASEPMRPENWMLSNLPPLLQHQKVHRLAERFGEVFGHRPASFRAGRFALGPATVQAISEAGFSVDSSVTPFIDWRPYGAGPDFTGAPVCIYAIAPGGDPRVPAADGPIIEVPLSSGYTRLAPIRWGRVDGWLRGRRADLLHLPGLFSRLRLLHKGFVSPESETISHMVEISRRLVEHGATHVHAFFHSPSLVPGLGPFCRTPSDVERLGARLSQLVERLAASTQLRMATVSEAALSAFGPGGQPGHGGD